MFNLDGGTKIPIFSIEPQYRCEGSKKRRENQHKTLQCTSNTRVIKSLPHQENVRLEHPNHFRTRMEEDARCIHCLPKRKFFKYLAAHYALKLQRTLLMKEKFSIEKKLREKVVLMWNEHSKKEMRLNKAYRMKIFNIKWGIGKCFLKMIRKQLHPCVIPHHHYTFSILNKL